MGRPQGQTIPLGLPYLVIVKGPYAGSTEERPADRSHRQYWR